MLNIWNREHLYLLPLLPIAVVVALSILHWISSLVAHIHNQHVIRAGARAARKVERERKSHYKLLPASGTFNTRPAKRKPDLRTIFARWFSVKIFISWLVLSIGWSIGCVSSRTFGTARDCALQVGLIMLIGTAMLVYLSILCVSGNNWQADDRPLSQRAWVSGRAFVSTAFAFVITNASLLLYAKGWL
ncbi:MAG TPA: hypothetical protein VN281_09870 [Verrucomicrobiae bacterium]|nr:hypothetical protein [Verrucomicrobiae bacterium]